MTQRTDGSMHPIALSWQTLTRFDHCRANKNKDKSSAVQLQLLRYDLVWVSSAGCSGQMDLGACAE